MEQARQKTVWRRRWLLLGLLAGLLGGLLATVFFPRPWSRPSLPISIQLPPGLYNPGWSLDGHSVMLIESGGSAYAWNLSANTLIDRSSFYQSHKGLALAEFGPHYVVYIFLTGAVQVFDPVTGVVIVDYQDQRNHRWEHLLFNTDEKKMALISDQNDFQIWDLQTGQVERSFFLPGTNQTPDIAWSADEQKLAIHYPGQEIQIWNVASGTMLHSLPGSSINVQGATMLWAPDNTRLLFTESDYVQGLTTHIWDSRTGRLLLEYHKPFDSFVAVDDYNDQWLADGQSILLNRGQLLVSAATGQVLWEASHASSSSTSVSPDGKLIAVDGGETIEVLDARTGRILATHLHALSDNPGEWSPDSRYILSVGENGRAQIWEAQTGNDHYTYSLQVRTGDRFSWSPDGSMIALTTSSSNATPTSNVWKAQETAYILPAP
jgi:WD40 repeat protein